VAPVGPAGNLSSRSSPANATTSAAPDTTPPTVSIISPVNGQTVQGTLTVSANASDNVGVVGVQFFVDGAPLGAEDTSAPYSVSVGTSTSDNGSHTLTRSEEHASEHQSHSEPVCLPLRNR